MGGWAALGRVMDAEDPYRAEMLLHACNLGSTEAQYKLGKYYLAHEGEEQVNTQTCSTHDTHVR